MTTGHKITASLAGALVLLAAFSFYGWLKERDARNEAETEFVGVQARIEEYQERDEQAQKQLASALKSLESLKKTVQTPKQIVQAAPQVITLPEPVHEVTEDQAKAVESIPDAPVKAGDLVIPQASTKAWFDAQVTCKEDEAKLATCSDSLSNAAKIESAKDEQIATLQNALRGGTKWQRTKTALKWFGIGAAAGAAIIAVEK